MFVPFVTQEILSNGKFTLVITDQLICIKVVQMMIGNGNETRCSSIVSMVDKESETNLVWLVYVIVACPC